MRHHQRRAAAAGLVACAAGFVFGFLGPSASGAARTALPQGYYPDRNPGWSPSGRWLAFTRGTGTTELPWISLIDRAGKRLRRPPGYYGPFWSPDGKRMATLDGRSLWLADGDGSRQRRVGRGGYDGAWSPDGSLFAFSLGRLYVVNRDGSGLRKLPIEVPTCATCKSSETEPAWSPNGLTLVFVHGEAEPGSWGAATIWAADVDGRNVRRLSNSANAGGPSWSADGTRVAFISDEGGADVDSLHVVAQDGSSDRTLRAVRTFAWAPRGTYIAYEAASSRRHVYVTRFGRGKRWRLDLKGATSPSWAPDGRRLAVVRNGFITIAQLFGRTRNRVARGVQPRWSPDGQLIAYAGAACGPMQGIQLVTPAGTGHRQLTDFCFVVGTGRPDHLHGTLGQDRVVAGAGNDLILVRDRQSDLVSCGPGVDRVIADQLDRLAGCEHIER